MVLEPYAKKDYFEGTRSTKIKMSKREVPKINRDNFSAWKSLMKLHLLGIGDHAKSTILVEHVDPTRVLTTEDMKKKKEHN